MPTSIREQCLANFTLVFSGATGIGQAFAGVHVERNRDKEVSTYPSLIVIDGSQTTNNDNSGLTFHTLAVSVEGYVQSATAATLGDDANDLYARIVKAAVADYTLSGVAVDVRESDMHFEVDREGSKRTAAFSVQFEIDYMTKTGDPYTLGP